MPRGLCHKINEAMKEEKNKRVVKNEEPTLGGYNFQEFQKRLNMMKQRYGLSSQNAPNEISTTLNDLKAKVSNLLNRSTESDDQNFVNDLRTRIANLNRLHK